MRVLRFTVGLVISFAGILASAGESRAILSPEGCLDAWSQVLLSGHYEGRVLVNGARCRVDVREASSGGLDFTIRGVNESGPSLEWAFAWPMVGYDFVSCTQGETPDDLHLVVENEGRRTGVYASLDSKGNPTNISIRRSIRAGLECQGLRATD